MGGGGGGGGGPVAACLRCWTTRWVESREPGTWHLAPPWGVPGREW